VGLHRNIVIQVMVMFSNRTMCINIMGHHWFTQEFCSGRGGGFNKFRMGQTENGDLGAVVSYPLVKGYGGSRNLVQEI